MSKYSDLQVLQFYSTFRRSYGDHNFKIACPLNIRAEEGLASQSKRTDPLQSVHANGPAVTTSALIKNAASRPTCVDANTDFCEGGQRLCSEHLFIFIKNIFSISSPGLWEHLTVMKKIAACKIINIGSNTSSTMPSAHKWGIGV